MYAVICPVIHITHLYRITHFITPSPHSAGRGTSTDDGFGIAAAVLATLMQRNRSTVLCATHFHELTTFFDDDTSGSGGGGGCGIDNCVVDVHKSSNSDNTGAGAEAMDCTPDTATTPVATLNMPVTSSIVNMHASAHIDTVQNSITMLYEILPGPANHSYGIHVAKIAHFPDSIIQQARLIEEQLLHV